MDHQLLEQQKHYGYLEGWLSTILNVILFGIKYWAGIASGSVAILADAWHTLSDSLTSIIVILSTKMASKPADEKHPFGHGRTELIASVIIAVLLSVVAFGFITDSVEKLRSHTPARYGTLAIVVTVISIVSKELMAQMAMMWARKTGMKSLQADGWHHRSDAISSIVVLAGIFMAKYFWWVDAALALVVSAILFYVVYGILKESVSSLIGEDADEELVRQLKELADRFHHEELHLHHIHVHHYGNHRELTFHMRLPDDMTLVKAHDVATVLENAIRDELGMEATIHVEPLSGH